MNPEAFASVLGGKIKIKEKIKKKNHLLEPVSICAAPLRAAAAPNAPPAPAIPSVHYLPAVPTLVAHDKGGHGLVGAAGLHLGGQKGNESPVSHMAPRGGHRELLVPLATRDSGFGHSVRN